ncbi:hypothetical protein BLNAU_292 [Blattamonas nauphoetae]|uniref:TPPC8 first Ig-like domain-containing protein n=1 Tax=Blattamonas nauphoetae TaxID=2049346 RepID=A0ABQ9YML3_9EUKA|nr:hypothetical protein BLNAU_292 [Blattamonas nauphoetae]
MQNNDFWNGTGYFSLRPVPYVLLSASKKAEAICNRNHLSTKEFLSPFLSLQTNATVPTPEDKLFQVTHFQINLITPSELLSIKSEKTVDASLLNKLQSVAPVIPQFTTNDTSLTYGDTTPDVPQTSSTINKTKSLVHRTQIPIQPMPWFGQIMQHVQMAGILQNYSTLYHPVGVLAVVSTREDDLLVSMRTVYDPTKLPNYLSNLDSDMNTPVTFLLLHEDLPPGSGLEPDLNAVLKAAISEFPMTKIYVLHTNSGWKLDPTPNAESEIHSNQFLSETQPPSHYSTLNSSGSLNFLDLSTPTGSFNTDLSSDFGQSQFISTPSTLSMSTSTSDISFFTEAFNDPLSFGGPQPLPVGFGEQVSQQKSLTILPPPKSMSQTKLYHSEAVLSDTVVDGISTHSNGLKSIKGPRFAEEYLNKPPPPGQPNQQQHNYISTVSVNNKPDIFSDVESDGLHTFQTTLHTLFTESRPFPQTHSSSQTRIMRGRALSPSNMNDINRFALSFLSTVILPHLVNQCIRLKRDLSRQKSGWGIFGSSSKKMKKYNEGTKIISTSSEEERRLRQADLLFLLGGAHHAQLTYHQLEKDFSEARLSLHAAMSGAMVAMCYSESVNSGILPSLSPPCRLSPLNTPIPPLNPPLPEKEREKRVDSISKRLIAACNVFYRMECHNTAFYLNMLLIRETFLHSCALGHRPATTLPHTLLLLNYLQFSPPPSFSSPFSSASKSIVNSSVASQLSDLLKINLKFRIASPTTSPEMTGPSHVQLFRTVALLEQIAVTKKNTRVFLSTVFRAGIEYRQKNMPHNALLCFYLALRSLIYTRLTVQSENDRKMTTPESFTEVTAPSVSPFFSSISPTPAEALFSPYPSQSPVTATFINTPLFVLNFPSIQIVLRLHIALILAELKEYVLAEAVLRNMFNLAVSPIPKDDHPAFSLLPQSLTVPSRVIRIAPTLLDDALRTYFDCFFNSQHVYPDQDTTLVPSASGQPDFTRFDLPFPIVEDSSFCLASPSLVKTMKDLPLTNQSVTRSMTQPVRSSSFTTTQPSSSLTMTHSDALVFEASSRTVPANLRNWTHVDRSIRRAIVREMSDGTSTTRSKQQPLSTAQSQTPTRRSSFLVGNLTTSSQPGAHTIPSSKGPSQPTPTQAGRERGPSFISTNKPSLEEERKQLEEGIKRQAMKKRMISPDEILRSVSVGEEILAAVVLTNPLHVTLSLEQVRPILSFVPTPISQAQGDGEHVTVVFKPAAKVNNLFTSVSASLSPQSVQSITIRESQIILPPRTSAPVVVSFIPTEQGTVTVQGFTWKLKNTFRSPLNRSYSTNSGPMKMPIPHSDNLIQFDDNLLNSSQTERSTDFIPIGHMMDLSGHRLNSTMEDRVLGKRTEINFNKLAVLPPVPQLEAEVVIQTPLDSVKDTLKRRKEGVNASVCKDAFSQSVLSSPNVTVIPEGGIIGTPKSKNSDDEEVCMLTITNTGSVPAHHIVIAHDSPQTILLNPFGLVRKKKSPQGTPLGQSSQNGITDEETIIKRYSIDSCYQKSPTGPPSSISVYPSGAWENTQEKQSNLSPPKKHHAAPEDDETMKAAALVWNGPKQEQNDLIDFGFSSDDPLPTIHPSVPGSSRVPVTPNTIPVRAPTKKADPLLTTLDKLHPIERAHWSEFWRSSGFTPSSYAIQQQRAYASPRASTPAMASHSVSEHSGRAPRPFQWKNEDVSLLSLSDCGHALLSLLPTSQPFQPIVSTKPTQQESGENTFTDLLSTLSLSFGQTQQTSGWDFTKTICGCTGPTSSTLTAAPSATPATSTVTNGPTPYIALPPNTEFAFSSFMKNTILEPGETLCIPFVARGSFVPSQLSNEKQLQEVSKMSEADKREKSVGLDQAGTWFMHTVHFTVGCVGKEYDPRSSSVPLSVGTIDPLAHTITRTSHTFIVVQALDLTAILTKSTVDVKNAVLNLNVSFLAAKQSSHNIQDVTRRGSSMSAPIRSSHLNQSRTQTTENSNQPPRIIIKSVSIVSPLYSVRPIRKKRRASSHKKKGEDDSDSEFELDDSNIKSNPLVLQPAQTTTLVLKVRENTHPAKLPVRSNKSGTLHTLMTPSASLSSTTHFGGQLPTPRHTTPVGILNPDSCISTVDLKAGVPSQFQAHSPRSLFSFPSFTFFAQEYAQSNSFWKEQSRLAREKAHAIKTLFAPSVLPNGHITPEKPQKATTGVQSVPLTTSLPSQLIPLWNPHLVSSLNKVHIVVGWVMVWDTKVDTPQSNDDLIEIDEPTRQIVLPGQSFLYDLSFTSTEVVSTEVEQYSSVLNRVTPISPALHLPHAQPPLQASSTRTPASFSLIATNPAFFADSSKPSSVLGNIADFSLPLSPFHTALSSSSPSSPISMSVTIPNHITFKAPLTTLSFDLSLRNHTNSLFSCVLLVPTTDNTLSSNTHSVSASSQPLPPPSLTRQHLGLMQNNIGYTMLENTQFGLEDNQPTPEASVQPPKTASSDTPAAAVPSGFDGVKSETTQSQTGIFRSLLLTPIRSPFVSPKFSSKRAFGQSHSHTTSPMTAQRLANDSFNPITSLLSSTRPSSATLPPERESSQFGSGFSTNDTIKEWAELMADPQVPSTPANSVSPLIRQGSIQTLTQPATRRRASTVSSTGHQQTLELTQQHFDSLPMAHTLVGGIALNTNLQSETITLHPFENKTVSLTALIASKGLFDLNTLLLSVQGNGINIILNLPGHLIISAT